METIYYNLITGSTGTRDDWYYTDADGNAVNAVDKGEVLEITPNGQAYLDHNTKHGCHYTTLATDETGNEYRLIWLVNNESLLLEADECCNWSQPDYVVPQ